MNPNPQCHPLCNRGSPLAAGGRATCSRQINAAQPLRPVAALLATSPTSQGRTKSIKFSLFQKLQNEARA